MSSYLAHLYHQTELLSPDELLGWAAHDKIWKYGDTESEEGTGDSDSSPPELDSVQQTQVQQTPERPARKGVKRKTTPRTPEGERSAARARRKETEATGEGDVGTRLIKVTPQSTFKLQKYLESDSSIVPRIL